MFEGAYSSMNNVTMCVPVPGGVAVALCARQILFAPQAQGILKHTLQWKEAKREKLRLSSGLLIAPFPLRLALRKVLNYESELWPPLSKRSRMRCKGFARQGIFAELRAVSELRQS